MNPKNYLFDWQDVEDQKKITEAFDELGITYIDLLNWKDNENYIFTKLQGEKLPEISISRKLHRIVHMLYKTPQIYLPINLSLDFLSPNITNYFKDGLNQGVASEIAGTTGSGKTFFLFILILYNCESLFTSKTNKAKLIYYDFLGEFNFGYMREHFKSNSYINQIELRQEQKTLSQFNQELNELMNCIKKDNIKYLFIDNLDYFFIDVENDREISQLEENFYRLTRLGLGIIYTCKLKKLYENKVSTYINIETSNKEKLELVSLESSIKSKYLKQTKRNSLFLYTHSGLKTKRKVLLMFENGIPEKRKYFHNLEWFDYVSFKNWICLSQKNIYTEY